MSLLKSFLKKAGILKEIVPQSQGIQKPSRRTELLIPAREFLTINPSLKPHDYALEKIIELGVLERFGHLVICRVEELKSEYTPGGDMMIKWKWPKK